MKDMRLIELNIRATYNIIKECNINPLHEKFLERYQYNPLRNGKKVRVFLVQKNGEYWYKILSKQELRPFLKGEVDARRAVMLVNRSRWYDSDKELGK